MPPAPPRASWSRRCGLLERAGRSITVVCNRARKGKAGADDLLRLDALFPRADALVSIPDDPGAGHALRGEFEWPAASRPLREAVLELAAVLALGWADLPAGAVA